MTTAMNDPRVPLRRMSSVHSHCSKASVSTARAAAIVYSSSNIVYGGVGRCEASSNANVSVEDASLRTESRNRHFGFSDSPTDAPRALRSIHARLRNASFGLTTAVFPALDHYGGRHIRDVRPGCVGWFASGSSGDTAAIATRAALHYRRQRVASARPASSSDDAVDCLRSPPPQQRFRAGSLHIGAAMAYSSFCSRALCLRKAHRTSL
jgi:hypothetical protein